MTTATNCMFAFPDRLISTPQTTTALSGGSWLTDMPLNNLKSGGADRNHTIARSTNALAASTKFTVDMGVARDINVIAITGHNAGSAATVRFRAYSDAGLTTLVHDTGALSFWTSFYPPGGFWTGSISDEDRAGWYPDFWTVLPATKTARYWLVEVVDTANPAGYFQLARCLMAPAWQPEVPIEPAYKIQFVGGAQEEQSRGGVGYFDELPLRRSQQFTFRYVNTAVTMGTVFEMQRRLGLHGELFFVFDPTDTYLALKQRSFLCTMKQLNALEFPLFNANTVAFELQELL